ncbi:hypothetical protein ACIRQP_04005 [Streptomyces sp. NPDC102274]|uniref:hypothetical protein n=1 Tax=Streptomyces sp. NPDC102274 TaxID=3366151 RepID=UPI0037FADAA8
MSRPADTTGTEQPAPDGRPVLVPDAAWCAVRFGARRPSVDAGSDAHTGLVTVSASVIWRAATGHGLVSVRLDAVSAAAGSRPYLSGDRPCDVHLWVDPDAPGEAEQVEYADVLVPRTPLPPTAARRRANELIARYPGCLVAAVPDSENGCVLGARYGGGIVIPAWPGADGSRRPAPPYAVAAVAHAWLVAGEPLESLRSVRLREQGGRF